MGDLSENFSRSEFGCKCCGEANVDPDLVAALQELRDLAGSPLIVISGYRCPKHNAAVGGAKKSQHMLGKAADIVIKDLTPYQVYRLAEKVAAFKNGGMGMYPQNGFVHVDVRGHKARWAKLHGRTVSIAEAMKNEGGEGNGTV